MSLMQHALVKNFIKKMIAIFLVSFSFLFAQENSLIEELDSTIKSDTILQNYEVLDTSILLLNHLKNAPDSLKDSLKIKKENLKSVLYLSGGENSVWFHLGVLYAIESYSIPIDSVVGVSWGAFIGYLWAKGASLDDIQRILLDPYITNLVHHNEMNDLYKKQERKFTLPISIDGMPSFRHRFSLSVDSVGNIYRNVKELEVDSLYIKRVLSRLRLKESLYRYSQNFKVGFSVGGSQKNGNSVEDVYNSLPLVENIENGELEPYIAFPTSVKDNELCLLSISDPKVEINDYKQNNSPWTKSIAFNQLKKIEDFNGIIIRAHSIKDLSRESWIQAGFSALERRLNELMVLKSRRIDYSLNKKSSMPWFKFNPVYDSVSAEIQSSMKSYWNELDTGMIAPENFAKNIMANPSYDSIAFLMQPTGDVLVNASIKPTFDVYAGGFGSNALGPNVYAGVSLYYVDQMEFNLSVPGFWGNESYGFMPRLKLSHLWNKSWSLNFGFDLMKLQPLKTFGNEVEKSERIYSEERRDFTMSVDYMLDDLQKLTLNFFFGKRVFELNHELYSQFDFETLPVSPSLSYEFLLGDKDRWFANESFYINGNIALQSIGFEFGLSNFIPIYWKLSSELRYTHSLKEFFTFSVAAVAGLDAYHSDGYGYVYPESFDYRVLDNCFRQQIKATPWSTEWYNADLLSHHYGLLRFNAGLHSNYIGAWIFSAYIRDYEENSSALLGENKFILEPAIRFTYKSLSAYFGISRIVDNNTIKDFKDFKGYNYFIRIGNYDLF